MQLLFQLNPPYGDEIRLDTGWVDLISSAKQISSAIADFILAVARISLYNALEVIAVAENKLADLSTDFAVKILKLTDAMIRICRGDY